MLRQMWGLKKETDLSFLMGRELIQVAIGVYQVQFHFDEEVAISVEAEFRYFDGQDELIWQQEPSSLQVASRTSPRILKWPTPYDTRLMRRV